MAGIPITTRYLTVGRSPFMGFMVAKESSVQPYMTDIAMHFASKLKNAIVSAARLVIDNLFYFK